MMVLHSHHCGGAESHLLHLMEGLEARGHQVLFAGPRDSWLGRRLADRGLPQVHCPMHGFYDLVSLARLARLARRAQVDIVHGHLTRGAYYAGWAGRLAGVPSVATAHSTNAGKHFGRNARIIAVSEKVRGFLRACGYPAGRLQVIYSGVPDAPEAGGRRPAVRRTLGLSPRDWGVAMVGRFIPDKGHDLLIEALLRLADRPRVFFVGDPRGPWADRRRRDIAAAGLQDHVCWLGQREDVAELLAAMDLLVAPSRREALPLVLLEAARAGLPVVATEVGGVAEVVTHGETGLLVPPDDPDALAQAMAAIMADRERARRWGANARRVYEQRFSHRRMVAETEELYAQVLGRAAP